MFCVCMCMHVLMRVWYFLLNLIRSQEAQVEIHVSEVGVYQELLSEHVDISAGRFCSSKNVWCGSQAGHILVGRGQRVWPVPRRWGQMWHQQN